MNYALHIAYLQQEEEIVQLEEEYLNALHTRNVERQKLLKSQINLLKKQLKVCDEHNLLEL